MRFRRNRQTRAAAVKRVERQRLSTEDDRAYKAHREDPALNVDAAIEALSRPAIPSRGEGV